LQRHHDNTTNLTTQIYNASTLMRQPSTMYKITKAGDFSGWTKKSFVTVRNFPAKSPVQIHLTSADTVDSWIPEQSNDTDENSSLFIINTPEEAIEQKKRTNLLTQETEQPTECTEGFELVVGLVHGGDQWTGYRSEAESIEACALKCTQTPGCGSFEYSPAKKRCYRKTQTRPTSSENRKGFHFCRRAPCPSFKTEAACMGPTYPKGHYSEEVLLQPGSYCIWSGGVCQAPMACTYKDCFLTDGGLPGMPLPPRFTLWIPRAGLESTMMPVSMMR